MTLHYHGLPLTPEVMLLDLAGLHVCMSYATRRPWQLELCMRRMQSVMFDNGAFTMHQQGTPLDPPAFYDWIAPNLGHPHWAVVPDVIGGAVEEQRALVASWPFPRAFGAPVWHLHLPLSYLLDLVREWPRVCLGSSAQFWQVGSPAWKARMREVFDFLRTEVGHVPYLHGLRMMAQAEHWPLASVDSVNVARNYKTVEERPRAMAERIDRKNSPVEGLQQRAFFL
ncbi:hypothetical protein [Methylobacterium fujisawaense]